MIGDPLLNQAGQPGLVNGQPAWLADEFDCLCCDQLSSSGGGPVCLYYWEIWWDTVLGRWAWWWGRVPVYLGSGCDVCPTPDTWHLSRTDTYIGNDSDSYNHACRVYAMVTCGTTCDPETPYCVTVVWPDEPPISG